MAAYLRDKVVVVTGAGRGIGRAVALAAAAEGAKVVVDDYGVAIDGAAPGSAVADEVVAEIKDGDAEDVAPMVVYLPMFDLLDQARTEQMQG